MISGYWYSVRNCHPRRGFCSIRILVNNVRVNTVIPRPWKLLESIQIFLSLHTRCFSPSCTKPISWSMYIFTSITSSKNVTFMFIWWIFQSMVVFHVRKHPMVIILATGVECLIEIHASHIRIYFAINWVLFLTISPNAPILVQNTHLHPTHLQSFRRLVNFHIMFSMRESYSSSIVASHLLGSLDLIAL